MKRELLYFTFFLLICLIFSLPVTAQVVNIPDPNLRAAIEAELGKASGTTITAGEMATLTELNARDASIRDLTGLGFATNLITLRLHNNHITDISPLSSLTELRGLYLDYSDIADISPLSGLIHLGALGLGGNNISDIASLAGLTHLKRLRLNHNRISDISPLSNLTELKELRLDRNNITDLSPLVVNTGLGSGDEINVKGNPLNHASINTHIPALQSRGVTVEFDDVTHLNFGEPRIVRLVYFLPSNRVPQQDINTKMDTLMKDVHQFYAEQMERHGFEGKTFTFETDENGRAIVHHVNGQFTDSYYQPDTFRKVWEEIREQFYTPQNIYFIAIDLGNERVGRGYNEICGVGDSHGASGGHVLIPASGDCFNFKTAAHELGHAFGLQHDFRSDTYIMSFGKDPNRLSECAAEWLDAHRYFNTGQSPPHFDNPTTIQMLPPLASPPYAIGLRFEVTDPDGGHQAQLLTSATIRNQDQGQPKLLSCKQLNSETDTITIEFITNRLTVKSNEVTLSVIDVYGNVTSQTYPIDITTILSTGTVSISDKNQVVNIPEPVPPPFTVRDAFELGPFYQQWIDVEGFPVLASAKVSSYALKEAAWLIRQMIGHRPDVLQALVQNRVRFTVIAYTEMTTDIPEYSDHRPAFYWDRRVRGLGGSGLSGHPAVSCTEENLLDYPGDTTASGYQLIHEFSHAVHKIGLNVVDPAFDNRLRIAYEAAMERGLWQSTYSALDRGEYWAQGAWYFFNEGTKIHSTGTELKNYDPGLAALLTEIYGDSGWQYTPTATRTHLSHLQGFNPQDSPTFKWPEDLEKAYAQLKDPDINGSDEWVNLNLYDPSQLSQLHAPRTKGNRTEVLFVNLTKVDVLVYLVRPDGTETLVKRFPANRWHVEVFRSDAGNIFIVKDFNGSPLAVFQTVEKTGRVLIGAAPIFITPGFSKISGDNQEGMSGTALPNPFVVEVQDENGSTLAGISVTFTVTAGGGTLSTTITRTDENGRAQSTLTLGPNLGTNTVQVSATGIESTVTFYAISDAESPPIIADVNSDGSVNILDLILIASDLGNVGTNLAADVSGDGVVNILDLILAAGMFDGAAAAPSAQPQVPETLTAVEVQGWLTDARALEVRNPITTRGFVVLEQLLMSLTPRKTELLVNYPNPFNPETWIPYRLAEDAFVTLTIYDLSGRVVRTLDVGHRIASAYENRSKAVYWNGRNGLGERVASSVYFYTLTAGDYSATRKMIILK